jgi:hypothetical protein
MIPTAQELNENIYFVHLTEILPPNGTMIPGNVVLDDSGQVSLQKHQDFLKHVPNLRMSIHWFTNDLVTPHENYKFTGKYVIIERAKFLRPQLYGGYAEDFFCIGPYRLSAEAVIFVPEDEIAQAKIELDGFKGKIISYSKSQSLKMLVKEWVNQNSTWQITIPENQTIIRTASTEVALSKFASLSQQMRLSILDEKAKRLFQLAKEAKKDGAAKFKFEDDCLAKELVLHCNNKQYLVEDFFRAWYAERVYYGEHRQSIFGEFEVFAEKLTAPLRMAYLNPDFDSLEEVGLPDGTLVIPNAKSVPLLVNNVRESLAKIEAELIKCNMPAQVLSYFEDEWKTNFAFYWLALFEEDILDHKNGRPRIWNDTAALNARVALIRDNVISHPNRYSSLPLGYQSTAALLSDKLGITFSAMQQDKSSYVDAVAEFPRDNDDESEEKFSRVHKHLRTQNIPFVFFRDDQTTRLIVPKVNTREIAQAVIEADGYKPAAIMRCP